MHVSVAVHAPLHGSFAAWLRCGVSSSTSERKQVALCMREKALSFDLPDASSSNTQGHNLVPWGKAHEHRCR